MCQTTEVYRDWVKSMFQPAISRLSARRARTDLFAILLVLAALAVAVERTWLDAAVLTALAALLSISKGRAFLSAFHQREGIPNEC